MLNFYKLICFLLTFILMAACAPAVQDPDKKNAQTPEIQTNDVALQQIYTAPYVYINQAIKNIHSTNKFSQKSIQNFFEVGYKLNDGAASDKAVENFKKLQQQLTYQSKSFENTYYLQLVEDQTKDDLKKSIDDVEKKIMADTDLIDALIDGSASEPDNKTTAQNTLSEQINTAEKLLATIIQKIQSADLFEQLKKQVPEKIDTESKNFLNIAKEFNQQMLNLKTLTQNLNLIQSYLKKLDIQIAPENLSALTRGQKLGLSIDHIVSPETTLQTLALTWSLLSIEERTKYFKSANEKLFTLFDQKTDAEIQCLIDGNCTGLISKLVLNLGVYPALADYGIEKIKIDLNTAAINFLNKKINAIAFEKISDLPQMLKTQIRNNVEKNLGFVQNFKSNFKINLAEGLKKEFVINSLDFYVLNTDSDQTSGLSDQLTLLTNHLYLLRKTEKSADKILQFSLIEKVISLVDFSNDKNLSLKNGLISMIKNPQELFLKARLNQSENSLLVKDQALALKFLSQMVTATADWSSGPFDHGITDILAQNLISDFKSDQLKRALFPKIELFNICFSYAVQVLKQIQSNQSLLYLVDNAEQRIPISEYLSAQNHPTVAMSAASDRSDHHKINSTKVSDLAALIEALASFSAATKDIEKSQSMIFKNADIRQQLQSGRKDIDMLILTLANFISSQMIGPKNLIDDTYNFDTHKLSQNYTLENQVTAISALVKAYEVTKIEIYLMTAKELYYAMNKNYFDPQLKFYKNNLNTDNGATTSETLRDDVLNSLNHLLPLRKYLALPSQVQFDRIFENWYVAILM